MFFGSSNNNVMNYLQIQSPLTRTSSYNPPLPIITTNAPANANILNIAPNTPAIFQQLQVNNLNFTILPANNPIANCAVLTLQPTVAASVNLPICFNRNIPNEICSPIAIGSNNLAANPSVHNTNSIMAMTQNMNKVTPNSVSVQEHRICSEPITATNTHRHYCPYINNNDRNKNRDKAFCCSECGKLFKHEHNLKIHWRMHNHEAFQCPFCDKKFARKANLMQHTRVHTDYRPWKCSFCVKAFKQKKCLLDHERTHSGERPFVCEFCKKAFRVKHNLMSHRRLHTGQRPYECALCVKKFVSKSSLNSHTRRKHPQHWARKKINAVKY